MEKENAIVGKVEWKSKYNSYVVYDYKPFCDDGFEITATVTSADKNTLDFVEYLYKRKQNDLELLENCLTL